MFTVFKTILGRDLTLAMRRKTDILTTLFFFIIVISIFPLGVGFDKAMLQKMAPGIAWIAALLASMIALERLFASDYEDGTLEQMLLSHQPLIIIVLAKVFAHWLLTGLPLVLIAPLAGMQYHLSGDAVGVMMLTLLLGTPILSLLGAIGAALTLGLRGGGVLIAVLILPLYVPILIYGAGAVSTSMEAGSNVQAYLLLLGAFLILALFFTPWATAAALRIASE
ncbi:MAG: heme exporter protein CcmB [Endozoicomonadaceae bacterium]|nr:heme exporter protein CcmB [Endozoicomonadaceae bacterium]